MTTPAVTETESAPVTVETPEVSLQERLNEATEEEYKVWEKTGEIPAIKPKSAEPPPKTEATAASAETSAVEDGVTEPPAKTESAAATEAARPQKKRTGDSRILQLLEENRKEREATAARIAELEAKIPKPAVAAPAATDGKTAEKRAKPKLADNDPKTGKPFTSIEAWSEAVDQWNDERINGVLEERLGKERQAFQQTETQRILAQETQRRSEPAMKKYPDFLDVVQNPKLLMPAGSTVEKFLLNPRTKNVGEIAYYLGKHPEILEEFYQWEGTLEKGSYKDKLDPLEQLRTLLEIEREVAEPVSHTTTVAKVTAPTKPLPPPPTVLAANGSAAGDPVEEALEKKSFADYEKAVNRSERRGRRA